MSVIRALHQQIMSLPKGPELPRSTFSLLVGRSDIFEDPSSHLTLVNLGGRRDDDMELTEDLARWQHLLSFGKYFISMDGSNFYALSTRSLSMKGYGGIARELGNEGFFTPGLTLPLVGRFGQTAEGFLLPEKMQRTDRASLQLFAGEGVALTQPMHGSLGVFPDELTRRLGRDVHFFFPTEYYVPYALMVLSDGSEILMTWKTSGARAYKDLYQAFFKQGDQVRPLEMRRVTISSACGGLHSMETDLGNLVDPTHGCEGKKPFGFTRPDGSILTGVYEKEEKPETLFVEWGLAKTFPLVEWATPDMLNKVGKNVPNVFDIDRPIPIPHPEGDIIDAS